MKRGFVLTLALVLVLGVAARVSAATGEVKVRRVEITLDKATVRPNQTLSLFASVIPANADEQDLYWESMNSEIAVVDEEGVVVGISPGVVEIRAASPAGRSASCTVTVSGGVIRSLGQQVKTADLPGAALSSGEVMHAAALRKDVEQALSGSSKASQLVTYRDKTVVSTAALRGAAYSAAYKGGSVRLRFFTEADGASAGYLLIDPALAPAEDFTIATGLTPNAAGSVADHAIAQFGRAAVLRLEHPGSFGMPVEVAARLDLSPLEGRPLTLYRYNQGRYIPLENQEYTVDSDGFFRFTATEGGYIIAA